MVIKLKEIINSYSLTVLNYLINSQEIINKKYGLRLKTINDHIKKNIYIYILGMCVYVFFTTSYSIDVNLSNSVKGNVFIEEHGVMPQKNDFFVFPYQGFRIHPHKQLFLKILAGVEGDRVVFKKIKNGYTLFYINNVFVGKAKPVSNFGLVLKPSITYAGIIPKGYVWAKGTDSDSFDSRYTDIGLIKKTTILGRAIKIF